MKRTQFDGWVSIFQSGTEYESEIVRDRLLDSGINAVLMTKRDRAFNLNVGALSRVFVLVAAQNEEEATDVLSSALPSDEELTRIALSADPENVDAPEGSE